MTMLLISSVYQLGISAALALKMTLNSDGVTGGGWDRMGYDDYSKYDMINVLCWRLAYPSVSHSLCG